MTPNTDDTQVGIAGGDGPKDLRDEITSYFEDRGDLVGEQMADLNPSDERWNFEEHLLIRAYAALSAQGGGSEPVAWATCQACGGSIEGWICQSCDREFHENDKGDLVMDAAPQPEALPVDGVEVEAIIERALLESAMLALGCGESVAERVKVSQRIAALRDPAVAAILAALPSNTGRGS